jgi:hypothetical protein
VPENESGLPQQLRQLGHVRRDPSRPRLWVISLAADRRPGSCPQRSIR